jgi:hypothetical protein
MGMEVVVSLTTELPLQAEKSGRNVAVSPLIVTYGRHCPPTSLFILLAFQQVMGRLHIFTLQKPYSPYLSKKLFSSSCASFQRTPAVFFPVNIFHLLVLPYANF